MNFKSQSSTAHSCKYCERLVIDCSLPEHESVLQSPTGPDMIRDKLVFDFTFGQLLTASSNGCRLCRWILNDRAVARRLVRELHHQLGPGDLRHLADLDDSNPDCLQPSLMVAVDGQDSETQHNILVAVTDPPFVRAESLGLPNDLYTIRYFGLYNPRTKDIIYRTISSLQLFATEQDPAAEAISTRPMQSEPSQSLEAISTRFQACNDRYTPYEWFREHGSAVVPKRLMRLESRGWYLQDMDERDDPPRFATLSYCWGGPQTTVCNKSSASHLASYNTLDELPATIQDAATVCRALGLGYLWVDALCIMQDDDAEKATEIAKIPHIYGGSAVVICASRARSAWDGFLGSRIASSEATPVFRLPWRGADGKSGSVMATPMEIYPEPIDLRGWTLQEQLLATRRIDFGTRQTWCTCRENLPEPGPTARYVDGWRTNLDVEYSGARDSVWHMGPGDRSRQSAWNLLVHRYTKRKLTFGVDRPLAISGIAEQWAKLSGDRYFAGLWDCSINAGLLWAVAAIDRTKRPLEFQGPTWSWLAVDSTVFNLQQWGFMWNSIQSTAVVVSIHVDPVSAQAPFGAVREGSSLRMLGRLMEGMYHRAAPFQSSDHSLDIQARCGTVTSAELYLDCADDAFQDGVSPAQGRHVYVFEMQTATAGPSLFTVGLILLPTAGKFIVPLEAICDREVPTLRRIGIFGCESTLPDFRSRSPADDDGWGERTERELSCFRAIDPRVVEIV